MTKTQRMRMTLDILMTLLSVALMGGTVLFPSDKVHQVLGMALLVLWAAHIALNRRWCASLCKGAYPPYRVMQLFVNAGIGMCALLVAASGMLMAWFVPVSSAIGFARAAHLAGSHWYYLFMCAHIGMHAGQMTARFGAGRGGGRKKTLALRIALALVCVYGAYAFVRRGVWEYLFLRRHFFFLDVESGYALFAADYVAMLVLFVAAAHYVGRVLVRLANRTRR
ncbi:MAG: endonuclease [Treponemataceae bacterium]|nr:endonuclease [Treponemataceae bacterium]